MVNTPTPTHLHSSLHSLQLNTSLSNLSLLSASSLCCYRDNSWWTRIDCSFTIQSYNHIYTILKHTLYYALQYMELILFSSMNAFSAGYYQLVNVGISTIRMKNNKDTASCDVDCWPSKLMLSRGEGLFTSRWDHNFSLSHILWWQHNY